APAPAPTPAPPPESGTFAAKLFSMGVEGGMVVRADEPAPEPAPASAPATSAHPPAPAQPERRPPSTPPSVGPSSSAPEPAPPSQAPSAGGPASDGAEIRMGAGPCLPPPPADDVIPWETLPALDAWEQLVGRIREGDEFLAAVLGQVGLVSLADGILRVAAPRGSFEHTELGRHQMRAQVEQFTRDHLGAPFTMELADGEPVLPELPSLVLVAQQRRAEHRAAVEAEARAHPGIQALLRTFDATLVSTKPLHEP
ncbi:MAG: hypothetical protein KDK70_32670, partial [Myxococcales bacterium]|nr:hypothetical protein [Myxococcales bacterium]